MTHKLYALLAFSFIGIVASAQKPFNIDGKIHGQQSGYIYLSYQNDGPGSYKLDSTLIKNGSFNFKGMLSGPVQARLVMERNGRSFNKSAQLFLTPGSMKLSVPYESFESIVLTGSPVHDEWVRLQQSKASIRAEMKPLNVEYEKASQIYREAVQAKKDEATLDALKEATEQVRQAMGPYHKKMSEVDKDFMDKHPSSYITAYLLRFAVSRMPLKEGFTRYDNLSAAIKKTNLGKDIKQELDELKAGSPGAVAFQFASQELRGGELKLTDFRGKYVLIDFWASWCVPCRKGNPHLLELYSKYKEKRFEIIGVSDDDNNLPAWKKAIEQDGIAVWKHVLRGLKRVDGPEMFDRSASISDKYGISSLPTKILIDPNGVIIGRYGGGGEDDEAMDKKLAEIFSEVAKKL
jgi:thiol-disulfide isomerase/thioredoxin